MSRKAVLEALALVFLDAPQGVGPKIKHAVDNVSALLDRVASTPELECLTPDELRAFKSFQVSVAMFQTMEPPAARLHVLAMWRAAEPGVRKLSIGPDVLVLVRALDELGAP